MFALSNNNNGFTLLEFLVSVIILTVGLLGLLQAVNMAITTNLNNTIRNEATLLADEQLSARISQLSTSDTSAFVATNASSSISRKVLTGFKNFSAVRTETLVSGSSLYTPTSLEVNVLVSWMYKSSRYTHNVSSVVSKRSR